MNSPGALRGRSALVTGASRGIGCAVAGALASAGARVFLLARSAGTLEQLAAELGDGAVAVPCDVTDATALGRAMTAVLTAADGAVDILVNNAGVFPLAPVADTSPASFE